MKRSSKLRFASLIALTSLFDLSAFTLLSLNGGVLDWRALCFGILLPALLLIQMALLRALFKDPDQTLIILVNFLVGIGLVLQYRIDPQIAFKQALLFLAGIAAMLICMGTMRGYLLLRKVPWLLIIASLTILLLVYFIGKEKYGAKNWLSVAGISFQPSEFVKVALVLLLAHYLSEPAEKPLWPLVGFVVLAVGMLMLERDLGAAVLLAGVSLITYYVATGNRRMTALALLAGCGGAVASYFLFDHVRVRVAIWKNPWTSYSTSGYQIAQGLMAIASGGIWGTGLSLGSPKLIPAYHTDYIFAVLCEEFGVLAGLCVIALYLVLTIRGVLIALHAPDRFHALVAFGASMLLALQSLIIIGGVTKLIPLTGITLPFMSYGGSSLIACMMLLGLLEAVAVRTTQAAQREELP